MPNTSVFGAQAGKGFPERGVLGSLGKGTSLRVPLEEDGKRGAVLLQLPHFLILDVSQTQ